LMFLVFLGASQGSSGPPAILWTHVAKLWFTL
jgi:hypothetical protein